MSAKPFLLLLVAASAVGGYFYWSQNQAKPEQSADRIAAAVPVLSAKVEQRIMPVRLPAVGTITAAASVAIKSRVDGQIESVGFRQGEDVRANQVLFTIDPRVLKAQLNQAEANVARDQAQLETARSDVKRYSDLVRRNLVTQQELEKANSTLAQVEAAIRANQAAAEVYRVQLSYTTIRSPIDGRAGALLLDRGNMVKANDTTPLVVINQFKPIDVTFSVPERELPAIRQALAAGKVSVRVNIGDDTQNAYSGELWFIDNAADPNTASIKLKARLANDDLALWPGQFAQVSVELGSDNRAIVVPAQAVQESQKGSYVYVIDNEDKVAFRAVTVNRVDQGMAVISKGLSIDERVVTDGQLRLKPGARVQLRDANAPTKMDSKAS